MELFVKSFMDIDIQNYPSLPKWICVENYEISNLNFNEDKVIEKKILIDSCFSGQILVQGCKTKVDSSPTTLYIYAT